MATVHSTGAAPAQHNANIMLLLTPEQDYLNQKAKARITLPPLNGDIEYYGGCFSNLSDKDLVPEMSFLLEMMSQDDSYKPQPHAIPNPDQILSLASLPHCSEFCEETFDFLMESNRLCQQIWTEFLYSPLQRELSD